jgi:hypothetical protein
MRLMCHRRLRGELDPMRGANDAGWLVRFSREPRHQLSASHLVMHGWLGSRFDRSG